MSLEVQFKAPQPPTPVDYAATMAQKVSENAEAFLQGRRERFLACFVGDDETHTKADSLFAGWLATSEYAHTEEPVISTEEWHDGKDHQFSQRERAIVAQVGQRVIVSELVKSAHAATEDLRFHTALYRSEILAD